MFAYRQIYRSDINGSAKQYPLPAEMVALLLETVKKATIKRIAEDAAVLWEVITDAERSNGLCK
jgi:hypothetical protein